MTSATPHDHILANALEAIGNTPCIRLNRVPQKHGIQCEVVAKCEFFNPGGSVKDRIGKQMVLDAEKNGTLKPGSVIVEATSGNTGIGLSMAAAIRGYRMVIRMPKKMSHEKETTLQARGAEVIRTETSLPNDHPESLIGVATPLRDEKGYVLLDQYRPQQPDPLRVDRSEIYDQCGGKVDMVVVSAGTGGTITGAAKKQKELIPEIIVVGVDPIGSVVADPEHPCEPVMYQEVEGIGYDFVPAVCERKYVDRWVKTRDQQSFDLARELHRDEGLLVGGSSGAAMAGVLEAAKDLRADQRCVVLMADGIRNYMGKFADTNWMIEHGFRQGEVTRPTYDALKKELEGVKAKLAQYESAAK
uniref:cystathionine beta-synthase n=1 Tax=Leishmania tarentolae TaxID=5689 RepID=Q9NG81_LEITA|nr:cystathionine beta-synthase [Leishmania tarentolae]